MMQRWVEARETIRGEIHIALLILSNCCEILCGLLAWYILSKLFCSSRFIATVVIESH